VGGQVAGSANPTWCFGGALTVLNGRKFSSFCEFDHQFDDQT
jgi:hypothetical protein